MSDYSSPRTERAPGEGLLFTANILAVLIVGVLGSIWILFYTDSFEAIGGLLGAGGALVWVAFVWKLLPKNTEEAIQSLAEEKIFRMWFTWRVCLLGFIAGFFVTGSSGTIEIRAAPDFVNARVLVQPIGVDGKPLKVGSEEFSLASGEHRRLLRWTSGDAPAKFQIKVRGYPEQLVTLAPRERCRLTVPYSFLRPVVLVRTTDAATTQGGGLHAILSVKVNEEPAFEQPFDARPVWIGCREMELPQHVLDSWDLTSDKARQILLDPQRFDKWYAILRPEDRLQLQLKRGTLAGEIKEYRVRPVHGELDVVQEVQLKPPSR